MRTVSKLLLLISAGWVCSASNCGQPPPQPVPEPLELTSVRPDTITEDETPEILLAGKGFQEGAEVRIGSQGVCSGVNVVSETELRCTVPVLFPGIYDVHVRNKDDGKASLKLAFTVEARKDPTPVERPDIGPQDCSVEIVFFGFNEAQLTDQARGVLDRNADCIKQKQFRMVRLEGHADERGSTEYNLALGQRRAEAVRKYLVGLGIGPSMLTTVSYGEEMPLEQGGNESAWARNRRVELKAK